MRPDLLDGIRTTATWASLDSSVGCVGLSISVSVDGDGIFVKEFLFFFLTPLS